ncbi:MAG: S-methyl-5'-thioadenosine phosphorylase [Phycisphaerae bacterium]|nr:S-methyl-5'-thioadenosine phosphorylase [Phycisphaerae bacterium]
MIKIGIIGGSGLGALLAGHATRTHERSELDTPFGLPSDSILETEWSGLPVLLLSRHGAGHLLNPGAVPYRANIFALKQLGCTHIIATGAVGSLREAFRPRDLVVCDQIIDRTNGRAKTFFENAAVHVEFAEPFCPLLRKALISAGKSLNDESFKVHERSCYVAMEGPAFSTRAESLMHRLWGGDLIGMTAMPEAKLAREAELPYALLALVTDYDCWRPRPEKTGPEKMLLEEIIGNLKFASDNGMALIRRTIERIAADPDSIVHSPASTALKLSIWSEKSRIDPEEVKRLAPLWLHYFQS